MRELRQSQIDDWTKECMAKFPNKGNDNHKYHVVYADPPWSYNQMGKVEGRTPYPTMSMAQLKALPVRDICEPTSVLFLWATNPLLDKALELIAAWGFEYKTVFKVWCKRWASGKVINGCGWWTRPSTELLLVATRGSGYMQWKQTHSEPQEFESVRGRHSEKPEEIRECVRRFFDAPGGLRRIELFARTVAPGFDAWGLEVPNYFATSSFPLTETASEAHLERS